MSNEKSDKQNKALRDFFIFTYFKTKECKNINNDCDAYNEYNNDLIQSIIKKAYNDATMMGAYNTLVNKELSDKSYSAYCEATKLLKKEIYSVKVNRSTQESFDKWHKKTCGKIIECYDEVNSGKSIFTYGNAQKWLNMALKYLWLLGALPNDIKEELLHAPIDSYILQKLWNLKAEGVTCSADTFYYKGNSWSKIGDYDDYFELQKVIRDMAKQGGKTVIEQENETWIEMAIERKMSLAHKRETKGVKHGT